MEKSFSSNGKPIANAVEFAKACFANSVDLVSASIDIDYTTVSISGLLVRDSIR
jgi:hypothetical protein